MNYFLSFVRLAPIRKFIELLVVPALDVLLVPFTAAAALLLRSIRRVGVYRMPLSHALFNWIGVFPIRDHYYEPLFNPRHLRFPLHQDRSLPGIDLNIQGQLSLLDRFSYAEELRRFPRRASGKAEYFYANRNFGPGDAEYLYSLIRLHKPARIVEIGSGMSTLMALNAIDANRKEVASYACRHVCVEPYEMPWLSDLKGVEVVRSVVQSVDKDLFRPLGENDILFIDSSHVIRPQGDVICEYLEILPILRSGVLIHVHDIFTPRDYPEEWVLDQVRFWNEQYLVEAFLSFNSAFRVVGAVNFLAHHHRDQIETKCPVLRENIGIARPASLWLQRI